MSEHALTPRQLNERSYYNEFSKLGKTSKVSFDPVSGTERRPWNSYWTVYEKVKEAYSSPDQRLLDFGCGAGAPSMCFAFVGYEVWGFDVSENNIDIARQLAADHRFDDRTHFSVGVAEKLEYPSDFFDVIVGIDILHHVDIEPAIHECRRVLKPGGLVIFREHLEAPLFDRIRNTRLVRRYFPKEKSFEKGITEDERKLTSEDLDILRSVFPDLQIEHFALFSRLDPYLLKPKPGKPSFWERLDYSLLKFSPAIKKLAGGVVLSSRI